MLALDGGTCCSSQKKIKRKTFRVNQDGDRESFIRAFFLVGHLGNDASLPICGSTAHVGW